MKPKSLAQIDSKYPRGTGFHTILKAMKQNGSPGAILETDEQSTFFLTTLPCHPSNVSLKKKVNEGINEVYIAGARKKGNEKLNNIIVVRLKFRYPVKVKPISGT